MTEEEIQDLKEELERVNKEKELLEKNQTQQNSYITKLEEKANGLASQMASIKEAANKEPIDPQITAYLQKKYVEEFISEGKDMIRSRDNKNLFPHLEEELDTFLKTYMTKDNASTKFVLDSYFLILGRAYENPDHAINKLEPKKESEAIAPTRTEPSNIVIPPVITDSDQSAGSPIPKPSQIIPDTRAAFKVLEDRLFEQGKNKFE